MDVELGSERVSCGPVDDAIWRAQAGVVVPIPTLRAELGEIARASTVEVAHLELGTPPAAAPQLEPVLDTSPEESAVRQPLPVDRKRLVVDAVVEKKLVVMALVPVALMKVKFWRVVEPET